MSPSTNKARMVFVSCLMDDPAGSMVKHLINYLKHVGIGTVISNVEIGPGEPMDATLRSSIEGCDLYVIVFSENYATSKSRLCEVMAIAEAAEAAGKSILPVFYGATVEDVKLITAKYQTLLTQHTSESVVTIEEWSNSLRGVAHTLGLNRPTRDADLCQEIRGRVLDLIREKDQSDTTLTATITGCPNLLSVENLGWGSTSRTFLRVENVGIKSLELQSQSKNLTETITIRNCHNLKEVSFGQWESLKVVFIECCMSIESLSFVGCAGKLEELSMANCHNLKVIQGLEEVLGSLKNLNIDNCNSLESMKLLKIPKDPNPNSCNSQDATIISPAEPDEESESSNSTPIHSSIISTSADHDEATVEMHQIESSLGVSSSTSLTETTQLEDTEKLTLEELNRLIELH